MSKRVRAIALALTLGLAVTCTVLPGKFTRADLADSKTVEAGGTSETEDDEDFLPEGYINLDASSFEDEKFLEYVKRFDLNNDGKLYQSELDQVKEIDVESMEIQSLKGIGYFRELTLLKCGKNMLTTLDLSQNKNLMFLYCQNNQLTELNIEKNTGLVILYCGDNQLQKLDVSHSTVLQFLSCQRNQIDALDLQFAKELADLQCFNNAITKLDVSRSPNLGVLKCYGNNISELKIGSSTKLAKMVKYSASKEIEVDALKISAFEKESTKLYFDTTVPEVLLSGSSFSDFIERLYVVALGRASDEPGKDFWIDRVDKEGYTGADCARFFLIDSGEFANRGFSNDQFMDVLYKTFFDREADAEGKAYWLGQLSNGKSRASIVNGFINSKEWCNLCAVYGIKPGASGAVATVPSQSASRFALRLYEQCLMRDAEAKGLSYWSLALTNREVSGSRAARSFFTSEEFENKHLSDEEFIASVYRTYMGREPDLAGRIYWESKLSGSMTREEVLDSFAESKEFTNICKDYGIARI
ncbi:MAG: DUF4214 domain-containing protein [Clostridiales bacterium]|nr:DUF4214 domain-containing protein [Clostridiales bacterium]